MNKGTNILVAIVMGSDSDLPVVKDAAVILEEFCVSYEIIVSSAHRSPDDTLKYVQSARRRGISVIIAAAGGAAHLAGVIASHFPLPVIGIPMATPQLGGVDSLYSTVQMPPGVPVASVGINAAKNAGILAIEILAVSDKLLEKKIVAYKENLAKSTREKSKKLQLLGYKEYTK
ncbi:5-(carboxyamino)imidazole ribonucleotide mutase [Candidatus Gottesmanbacteria bacterium]|nr:5-(carboxyamino)imidazole ribonucleotide mutase [Candidatus Gottesmanbacteria bacterium]